MELMNFISYALKKMLEISQEITRYLDCCRRETKTIKLTAHYEFIADDKEININIKMMS